MSSQLQASVSRSLREKFAVPKSRVNASVFLLSLLIISISISPRIRYGGGGLDADIRFQDLFLVLAILHLVLAPRPTERQPLYGLLGRSLPFFIWGSAMGLLVTSMLSPEVGVIRRVAFYGRGMEVFVLAAVVAGLYLRSGPNPIRHVLRAVHFGALLNLAWVAYQTATGTTGTLLGSEIGDAIESYGPKLIGEGSAFGTGQYFAFIAAVAAAQFKAGYRKLFPILLFLAAATSAYLADSRISLGAIISVAALVLIFSKNRNQLLNIGGTIVGLSLGFLAVVLLVPTLEGRISPDAVQMSFLFRVEQIWAPLVNLVISSPFVGIGPGGLTGGLPVEAHNIYLRAFLDYGIIVGSLFVFIFFRVFNRAKRLAKNKKVDPSNRVLAYLAMFSVASVLLSGIVQDALTGVTSSHLTMLAIGLFAAVQAKHSNQLKEEELNSNDS